MSPSQSAGNALQTVITVPCQHRRRSLPRSIQSISAVSGLRSGAYRHILAVVH